MVIRVLLNKRGMRQRQAGSVMNGDEIINIGNTHGVNWQTSIVFFLEGGMASSKGKKHTQRVVRH